MRAFRAIDFERTFARQQREERRGPARRGGRDVAGGSSRVKPVSLALWALALAWTLIAARMGTDELLSALVIYATGASFFRAGALAESLGRSPGLSVFANLPISDEDVFRHLWKRFISSSLAQLAFLLFAYGIATGGHGFGVGRWATALSLALLQWLVLLTLAALLAARRPRWPAVAGALLYFLCLWGLPGGFFAAMTPHAHGLPLLLLPAGWVSWVFSRGLIDQIGSGWGPLFPAIAAAAALPLIALHLLRGFRLDEVAEQSSGTTADSTLAPSAPGSAAVKVEESPRGEGAADWNQWRIRRGEFLTAIDWDAAGPLERIAGRLLTPREKTVCEYMQGGVGGWSARLRAAAAAAIVMLVLVLASPWLPDIPLLHAVALPMLIAVPALGGYWPGFYRFTPGGHPAFAILPIGYWEIAKAVLKVNVVRCLAWLPFAIGLGAAAGMMQGVGPLAGSIVAAKVLYLALVAQPVYIMGKFSMGCNDSSELVRHNVVIFLLLSLLVLGAAWSSIAMFTVGALGSALPAGALAVVSAGISLVYGWWYTRGHVDQVR